jgi:hypothetical protein
MSTILSTNVDGHTVYIEAEALYGSEETTSAGETLEKAHDAFEQAKTTITSVTKSMVSAIQMMEQSVMPDEFGLEFGIKFNAEGQAIVVKAGMEASLHVTITYKGNKKVG